MNQPFLFQYEGHAIRIEMRDGQPWWIMSDVCAAMNIAHTGRSVTQIGDDDNNAAHAYIDKTPSSTPPVHAANEPGLYALIFGNDRQKNELFKAWMNAEVMPVLRSSGLYTTTYSLDVEPLQWPQDRAIRRLVAGDLDYFSGVLAARPSHMILRVLERWQAEAAELGWITATRDDFECLVHFFIRGVVHYQMLRSILAYLKVKLITHKSADGKIQSRSTKIQIVKNLKPTAPYTWRPPTE